jgi:cytochrome c oxidase subunit 2
VLITLQARDVIHSFWLPNLAGKVDAIPGRTNTLRITALRPGWYRGQCAEFCGVQHAPMASDVRVDTAAEFERWRSAQLQSAPPPQTALQQRGYRYFQERECALCHRIGGTPAAGRQGPDLTHIAGRRSLAAGVLPNTPAHLAAWLADPQHSKPGNNMPTLGLRAEDIDALVAYLGTLQ